jgi:hypothetical protein
MLCTYLYYILIIYITFIKLGLFNIYNYYIKNITFSFVILFKSVFNLSNYIIAFN